MLDTKKETMLVDRDKFGDEVSRFAKTCDGLNNARGLASIIENYVEAAGAYEKDTEMWEEHIKDRYDDMMRICSTLADYLSLLSDEALQHLIRLDNLRARPAVV